MSCNACISLEAREFIEEANGEMRGVIVDTYSDAEDTVRVTHVQITTKNGAKAMGKPIGTYITLEAEESMIPKDRIRSVSCVCAGERNQRAVEKSPYSAPICPKLPSENSPKNERNLAPPPRKKLSSAVRKKKYEV